MVGSLHLMDRIPGFLEKHGQLEVFDDVWIAFPPCPGFLLPKKTYREVSHWYGKEMRTHGLCVLGVPAIALRQPGSGQPILLKCTLRYIRALVEFNMMAQYRSHTEETITYMENYLDRCHKMKYIFLEFGVTKYILAKINQQRRATT